MNHSLTCRLCRQQYSYNKPFLDLVNYQLSQCPHCSFVTLHPIPSHKALEEIYSNPEYHQDKSILEHRLDAQAKVQALRHLLPPTGPLLDYGTGNGIFLQEVSPYVAQLEGYDPNPHIFEENSHIKITTGQSSKRLYTKGTFQIITCFDVIEHIENFTHILDSFRYWLAPGGYVCLTTPSLDCWDAKLLGKRWYGYTKVPQHINYFDQPTITRALEQSGYVVESITQWGFVRSLAFILKNSFGGLLPSSYLNTLYMDRLHLFIPAVDMMVIAKVSGST